MNVINALVSLGLGLTTGALVLGAGLWMDRARSRRWDRELNAPFAPTDVIDVDRDNEENEENDSV